MIFVASDSNIKDSVEKIVSPASQSSTKETNIKRHQIDPLDPFQDRWKTVDLGEKIVFHVYSAFALSSKDNQVFDQIRITAAIPSKYVGISAKTKCLVETDDKTLGHKEIFVSESIKVDIQKEHFSLKWTSSFLLCSFEKAGRLPFLLKSKPKAFNYVHLVHEDDTKFITNPKYNKQYENMKNLPIDSALRVHYSKLDAKETSQKMEKMAVCVKPFHLNYNRALWLVEFMEMYQLQGATHFIFYNHTVGPDVESILNRYQELGIVSTLTWNLPLNSKKDIRTEAIFTAINDCNMRAAWLFEYLVVVDLDEYILPTKSSNLTSFLDTKLASNKNAAYFLFQNVFHYLYWENSTRLLKQEWKNNRSLPYLLTQTKLRRTKQPHKHQNRSKYVTRPDKVTNLGNHNVWSTNKGYKQIKISQEEGLSHHYRICEYGGYDCLKKSSVNDSTALKWGSQLIGRVDKTCQEIFGEGKSCPEAPPLGSPW